MTKICTKCKKSKPLSEFNRDRTKFDGFYSSCRLCNSDRKSYFDSRKKLKAEYDSKIYEIQKNEKKTYSKAYYQNNKKRVNAYYVEKGKTDINFKLKSILRKRIAKLVSGHTKGGSAVSDLGCTIDEFKSYLESLFKSGMSWSNYGFGPGKWQIDHIDALMFFNLQNRKEFLKAANYKNLQPIWHEEHLTKTKKDLKKYYANP
jgi:hypothetical protein